MAEITLLDREIYKQIDAHLEFIYPESVKLAEQMKTAGIDTKSQIRGFETLVNATTRFSEILNYIKNQAGKEKKENKWQLIAPSMLSQLNDLEKKSHELAGGDPQINLAVKLRLARGWAKQVVCHFLYLRK